MKSCSMLKVSQINAPFRESHSGGVASAILRTPLVAPPPVLAIVRTRPWTCLEPVVPRNSVMTSCSGLGGRAHSSTTE